LLPDVAASVIAQMQQSGYLSESFIEKALECCQDILQDKNYEQSFLRHLYRQLNKDTNHIILVAGCQSRPILRARVDAAINLVREFQVDIKIVFSGRNPGTRLVKTLNEAREMERYFYSRLENNPIESPYRAIPMEVDEESHSTITNIKEFLDGEYVAKGKQTTVFIVSSLFHLLRLSDAFESQIEDHAKSGSIDKIVLVGGEDSLNPSKIAQMPRYIKLMMFDIYTYLLEYEVVRGADRRSSGD